METGHDTVLGGMS